MRENGVRKDVLGQPIMLLALIVGSLACSEGRASSDTWDAGDAVHILATVNDRRMLLKVSFRSCRDSAPVLRVGDRSVAGKQTDSEGRFWYFDAPGLDPGTTYDLGLLDASGAPLCDAWKLATFPARDALPDRFRLVCYTGGGGNDVVRDPKHGGTLFLPLASKIRLLERALTFEPDALISIGDNVYWDLLAGRSAKIMGASPEGRALTGPFDRAQSVLGTANEEALKKAVGPQVAGFYGTLCRSIPVFLLMDDHDYFENDHADDAIVTFPPDPFMLRLARASQYLYYPEFLPDARMPRGLGGASAADRPDGVSECFGTLRYGRLVEVLLYDCRRFLSLKGPSAVFVPRETEQWLADRMASSDARHVVNTPSVPVGWSAGKWAEWYPDILGEDGRLTDAIPKPYWQAGWAAQHDRLLQAAASRTDRIPLFVSGDLHCHAAGRIFRAGQVDLSAHPVVTVVAGALGTGPLGWPSAFRHVPASPPTRIELEEDLTPVEQNGFTLVDFTPDKVVFRFFAWRPEQGEQAIDTLEPFHTFEVVTPG